MRYGFYLPTRGGCANAEALETIVQRGEALGFHSVMIADHVVFPTAIDSKYPYTVSGVFPGGGDALEQLTLMAFVAGRTRTLRLRTLVTGVTYRHPGLLAKTVTTLDVVSGGRAELGIGAAWYEREHLGLGVPFPPVAERFERLEEAIQICLQMWSDDNGAYRGRHYQLDETLCSPMPVSSPRPTEGSTALQSSVPPRSPVRKVTR